MSLSRLWAVQNTHAVDPDTIDHRGARWTAANTFFTTLFVTMDYALLCVLICGPHNVGLRTKTSTKKISVDLSVAQTTWRARVSHSSFGVRASAAPLVVVFGKLDSIHRQGCVALAAGAQLFSRLDFRTPKLNDKKKLRHRGAPTIGFFPARCLA